MRKLLRQLWLSVGSLAGWDPGLVGPDEAVEARIRRARRELARLGQITIPGFEDDDHHDRSVPMSLLGGQALDARLLDVEAELYLLTHQGLPPVGHPDRKRMIRYLRTLEQLLDHPYASLPPLINANGISATDDWRASDADW